MMADGMTVFVALVALCVVNLILIWQVATLAGMVHDLNEDMHSTAEWLVGMEAHRLSVARRKKDGMNDED